MPWITNHHIAGSGVSYATASSCSQAPRRITTSMSHDATSLSPPRAMFLYKKLKSFPHLNPLYYRSAWRYRKFALMWAQRFFPPSQFSFLCLWFLKNLFSTSADSRLVLWSWMDYWSITADPKPPFEAIVITVNVVKSQGSVKSRILIRVFKYVLFSANQVQSGFVFSCLPLLFCIVCWSVWCMISA